MTGAPSLPPERTGRAAPPAIAAMRDGIARAAAAGAWRTDPPAEEGEAGGVRTLRWRCAGEARAEVLHFHGGGYRIGLPEMTGPYAAALAARCAVDVVCPAYRLAPDDPFPAALADGVASLRALAGKGGAELILSGDSAGGGLAAAVAALAPSFGVEVAALVMHSPWLDLTVSAPAYARNAASDRLFSRDPAALAAEFYLQGLPAGDPLASPLFADPAAFPPSFVSAGLGEVLVDDARRFAERLSAAGREVELLTVAEMEHTAVIRDFALTGAQSALEATVAFLDRQLRD